MATAASLADQLLERHVQHELRALSGDRFLADLRAEVGELFNLCSKVTLNELVSPARVNACIRRNVVELEIHGGIPELVGEMTDKVRSAPVQRSTRLKDILSAGQMADFVDQALTLREHRERLVDQLLEQPIYQELVAELVYHGIVNYIYEENLLSKRVPAIAATMKMGKRMFNKAIPGLDATLEKNLKAYIRRSLPFLVRQSQLFINGALTDEELKDSAMALWHLVEDKSLADLQDPMGDLELQEFVVLGYEFWQSFRETPYFQGCYEAVVEHLFDKYGDEPVSTLIGDMGVTRAMVDTELESFAPPLFEALHKHGYLEAMLRRRLGAFYHSDAARELLGDGEAAPKAKPSARRSRGTQTNPGKKTTGGQTRKSSSTAKSPAKKSGSNQS